MSERRCGAARHRSRAACGGVAGAGRSGERWRASSAEAAAPDGGCGRRRQSAARAGGGALGREGRLQAPRQQQPSEVPAPCSSLAAAAARPRAAFASSSRARSQVAARAPPSSKLPLICPVLDPAAGLGPRCPCDQVHRETTTLLLSFLVSLPRRRPLLSRRCREALSDWSSTRPVIVVATSLMELPCRSSPLFRARSGRGPLDLAASAMNPSFPDLMCAPPLPCIA
ncbi:uncharacterized protein LOC119333557 [Triticum dicoccoides]|uniref:uncharacterized protein LOC119333557 n=1 Tax=Triticum dicoccoides TaxID=85692 RepID=UPI00189164D9|nr:uncharacterized protein LOC119333557 [Triticum dicoccoides]